MVFSSVVSVSSGANKPVSAETHPDGAHSVHSDSRYATITKLVPLSLVSPSVSASPGTDKSISYGSFLVPSDTSSDSEFAVLQSKLQQILSSHAIEPSKTWGTSKKWVLELRDGRQVVVPIEIKSQLIDSALVSYVDVEQKELINLGNRLRIIQSNSKWDTVLVEDVDSNCSLEDVGDLVDVCQHYEDSLEPLSVTPLAMSSSMEAPVIRDHSDRVEDVSPQMSQWFQSKFQGFDDFLETSVEGLEEVATSFLLAVEAKMKQRKFELSAQKKKIKGGRRGLRELQSLTMELI